MRSPCEVSVTAPIQLAARLPIGLPEALTALAQAPTRLVSCLKWRTARNWSIPWRTLDDLFIFLPVQGDLVANDEALPIGSVAIVPPGVAHRMRHARGGTCSTVIALHAHLSTASGMPWPFPVDRLVARLPDHGRWVAELTRLAGICQSHPDLGAAFGRGLVRHLLIEAVLAGHPLSPPPSDLDPRLAALLARLQATRDLPSSTAALAKELHLGPLRLRQLFHAGLGCTPKAWLDRQRLARAAERLRAGMGVAEAARAGGFGTIRRLQVRFKSAYGRTPSSWRQAEPAI